MKAEYMGATFSSNWRKFTFAARGGPYMGFGAKPQGFVFDFVFVFAPQTRPNIHAKAPSARAIRADVSTNCRFAQGATAT
ncbi:MAG: hypothetical protein H7835_21055, partial [Magnetococcus sp. XQGC-1]